MDIRGSLKRQYHASLKTLRIAIEKCPDTMWNNPADGGAAFCRVAYHTLFFAHFYLSIVYNPDEVADNVRKQGGFIPGIRPGPQTTRYLNGVVMRITIIGALGLGLIAIREDEDAAMVMGVTRPTLGQAIYSTGFEPPTFAEGTLVGQDGWIAPPPLSANCTVLSPDDAAVCSSASQRI